MIVKLIIEPKLKMHIITIGGVHYTIDQLTREEKYDLSIYLLALSNKINNKNKKLIINL